MNSWSLAMESGFQNPDSQLSTDGGATWSNQAMGYHHVSRAEYLVADSVWRKERIPNLLAGIPENHPASLTTAYAKALPEAALAPGSTLARVQAITAWISTGWEYCASHTRCPIRTLGYRDDLCLGTGKKRAQQPAANSDVRPLWHSICHCLPGPPVFTGTSSHLHRAISGGVQGHFAAEVWNCLNITNGFLSDPNVDLVISKDQVPLSIPRNPQFVTRTYLLILTGGPEKYFTKTIRR